MSWKKHTFGNEKPSALRVILTIFFLLVVCLAFFGAIIADFVPTDSWKTNALYLTTGTTIATLAGLIWGRLSGRIVPVVRISKFQNAIAFAFLPFMVFGAFWATFTYAIPDVMASVFAVETTKTITGEVSERKSKRRSWGCNFYIRGEAARNAVLGSICSSTPIGDKRGIRQVRGRIVLTVKETAIGYHVVRVDEFFPDGRG